MPATNVYSVLQGAISRGIQYDSARRQLNRLGYKAADVGMQDLWVRATEEFANGALLQTSDKAFVPTRGQGLLDSEFKEPWNNRYVVEAKYIDPATGALESTQFSINSNVSHSIEGVENIGMQRAQYASGQTGKYLVPEGATIQEVTLVNAYANA
jgi:hypothetical protein